VCPGVVIGIFHGAEAAEVWRISPWCLLEELLEEMMMNIYRRRIVA